MAKRCGCASDTCVCHVVAGTGVAVAGSGSTNNPFVVTSLLDPNPGPQVQKDNVTRVAKATIVDFRGGGVTVDAGGPDEAIVTISAGSSAGGNIPAGVISMWGGLTAPAGWLLCNGTSYLNSAYPDLSAALGTRFGGDATHFNVPNMADRFPIGASATKVAGTKAGSATKAIATTNLPPHAHTIAHTHPFGAEYFDDTATSGGANRITDIQNKTGGGGTNITPSTNAASTGSSGSTGSGTPLDVTPPYVAFAFIIKAS